MTAEKNQQEISLIAAYSCNNVIGKDGRIPWYIPGEQKRFKTLSSGNVVVMGRKTLESMPGGKGLPGRVNIVLTRNTEYQAKDAQVVHTRDELMKLLEQYDDQKVFIIGGGSIYREFYKYCSVCYITKINAEFDADTFMVNLDEDDDFKLTNVSPEQEDNGINYTFCTYENAR